MDKSFPIISYAEVVRSSKFRDQLDARGKPMTWFEEVESSKTNKMISRSNSTSTIQSDDTDVMGRRSNLNRRSTSHSLDSGQASDLSSDNETCSKSSIKCDVTCFENVVRNQKMQKEFHRRESFDSCHTSSSTYTDHDSPPDGNQLSLMLSQRWARMDKQFERDEATLVRRQKQIDYGKNTIGYQLYSKAVPREKRTSDHPQTPDKRLKYSRRAFDGLVKIWRKELHKFDPYDPSDLSDGSDIDASEC